MAVPGFAASGKAMAGGGFADHRQTSRRVGAAHGIAIHGGGRERRLVARGDNGMRQDAAQGSLKRHLFAAKDLDPGQHEAPAPQPRPAAGLAGSGPCVTLFPPVSNVPRNAKPGGLFCPPTAALSLARLTLLLALLLPLPAAAQGQTVTVFAAASLTDSLKQVADAYKARTGTAVTLSFGASSTLARQIEQGAAADIFFSADTDWMDYLEKAGQIAPGTRKDLLGNRLVLVAASDAKPRAAHRARLRSRRRAGQWPAGHGRSGFGAGRQIRQGGADRAGRVGQGRGQGGAGRECAGGAGICGARRSAVRHRLCHRCEDRAGQGGGHLSGKQPSAHHLSGGADQERFAGGARVSDLSGRAGGARDFREGRVLRRASACTRPKRRRAFPAG